MIETTDDMMNSPGSPAVDPHLSCDLKDIEDNTEAKIKYIEKVKEALQRVYDPEISVDIYNLGLVYDVKITKDNAVWVLMSLTSAFCPAADIIPQDIIQEVSTVEGITKCEVRITMTPQWGREMIEPNIRDMMGL
jgi:metal-sulfur cluster biosynthetic enzyme